MSKKTKTPKAEPVRDETWRDLVLSHDLFAGDFGDGSERTLCNKIAIAKRGGKCRECTGPIKKGETIRVIKMVDSEGFYGGRCCQACCDAMALSASDGGKAMDARAARASQATES